MTTPPTAKRAALYLRVSTDRQDVAMQETTCTAYALRENLPIVTMHRDILSGSRPWRERALAGLIAPHQHITDLLVYEYSRLGRDMLDTLDFIKECNDRGVSLHVVKNGTVVRADIGGKVISTVMSLAAEIERDLLRQRTTDALKQRQKLIDEKGGFTSASGRYVEKLGRPAGTTRAGKLGPHVAEIMKLHAAQTPAAAIGRLLNCDARTVTLFIKRNEVKA
jgi:DNA invertase Pin-like site-specific DNA recombinase